MKKKMYMFIVCLVTAIMGGIIAEGAEIVGNGSTDVSLYVVIEDANGDPNVSADADDLDLYYVEYQSAISSKIDLTSTGASATGHTDNTAIHIGNGLFKIDPPDIAFDGGIGTQVTFIIDDGATSNRTAFLTVLLTPPVDAVAVSGDTTTANNLEAITDEMLIVYQTDFATNYDTTLDMWNVDVEAFNGNAAPTSVANAFNDISSTSTAATAIVDEWENQSLTDPTGFRVNVMEVAGTAQTANDMSGDIDDILEDTGTTLPAAIAAISTDGAAWHSTTVVSASSTSAFIITSGVSDDDDYNGFLVTVTDADGDNVPEPAFVDDYNGDTLTVTLSTPLSFTPASGDTVQFLAGFGGDFGITLFRK